MANVSDLVGDLAVELNTLYDFIEVTLEHAGYAGHSKVVTLLEGAMPRLKRALEIHGEIEGVRR